MKYQAKLTNKLRLGDEIYISKFTPSGDVLYWECLGYVVKLHKPFNGMGSTEFGYSQGIVIYNEEKKLTKYYYCFENMPLMVKIKDE